MILRSDWVIQYWGCRGRCLKQSAPNVTCQWGRRSHPKNTYRWCILCHNIVLCISLNWKFQEAKSSICFISSITSKKCYQINEYRYKWEFKLLSHKDNCPSPRETATSLLLIWWLVYSRYTAPPSRWYSHSNLRSIYLPGCLKPQKNSVNRKVVISLLTASRPHGS